MPGLTGIEACRKVGDEGGATLVHLLILTSRDRTEDLVAALEAGADDHVGKPFEPNELRARVRVGERVVALQRSLAERVVALERALADVHQLQGLVGGPSRWPARCRRGGHRPRSSPTGPRSPPAGRGCSASTATGA